MIYFQASHIKQEQCDEIYNIISIPIGSKTGVWTSTHRCGMSQAYICEIGQGVTPIEPTTTRGNSLLDKQLDHSELVNWRHK